MNAAQRQERARHALVSAAGHLDKIGLSNGLSRKQLRATIDAVQAQHDALAALLIASGMVTRADYEAACAARLEAKVAEYEQCLDREFIHG